MEVFVEPIEAVPRLVLCGAGHVAQATAPIARSIGFEVVVIDEREELNTPERFAGCSLELRDPSSWLRRNPLGERDWLLIVTHDHALDEQVLELALAQAPHYIGLVGSRRKTLMIASRLAERLGPVALDRVYAPVGLDLGALGPAEVAVAIAAELVALRRGKAVAHLRLLGQPSAPAETE
jgi:xanthine dehydrogenase accessory factor